MSDVGGGDADGVDGDGADHELPTWLSEAILSEGPPAEAVELVKASFTWRTIEAELLELSYDSALDVAGVRDAAAVRTMEFVLADLSILIEVDGSSITGRVIPAAAGDVSAEALGQSLAAPIDAGGGFMFRDLPSGPLRLVIRTAGGEWTTAAFVVGR